MFDLYAGFAGRIIGTTDRIECEIRQRTRSPTKQAFRSPHDSNPCGQQGKSPAAVRLVPARRMGLGADIPVAILGDAANAEPTVGIEATLRFDREFKGTQPV